MEASSTGGTKYLFLPAGHKLLALNRSLFKCSYQVAIWEGRKKMGLGLGSGRVGRAVGTMKRQWETALQNALRVPVRYCRKPVSGWSMVSLSQPGADGVSVTHDFSRFVLWTSRSLLMPS